jgi:predicted ATPase
MVAKLRGVVQDLPDGERVVARIAGLLGVAPPAAPEETFWAVRTMLESLARESPLVIVLDDVHWGQPMLLDLIEHLVEWARDASILLIAVARPELRELREALAAPGRRVFDVIELEPLEPAQTHELVGALLGDVELPDELLSRILQTTEGNPLFIGELLRMLVEEGSLARDGDVWVAAGGAETVQVPPTIQALLTARIERLRAEERSVVERASVIGKQFYRGAVAELVAPRIRSGIDGHLETLRRKDMVEPEGTYWIDEPVYRFHHILIRDAAYHLLLKEARAELHEKFADWLETKAGELVGEHEEVIAYHLEQAHEYRRQLGPLDDRGQLLGARAAERLASAGRRALAREDLAAAANLLQRALDRNPGALEDEILWQLGEALLSAGDTANAAAVVDHLAGPRGEVLGAQLAVLTAAGRLEQTLERASAATAALAAAEDAAGEAKGHHVTAQVQAQLGRVADV